MSRYRYEWETLDWRTIQLKVFKLQKRIYKASREGNVRKFRRLQRLLVNSRYACLLAVRRITQDNRGKRTAGIDGVKSLTPLQRLALAKHLSLKAKATPLRRVYIPKGEGKVRPLGIPTIKDRALQALVQMALEPEWEAKFEPNSYGFRRGRSCHDAVQAVFSAICQKPQFVLDADIEGCFDNISHAKLLNKLNTSPTLNRPIKQWLKAGIMEGEWKPTDNGTPQGGVISPLLANIALHGLETLVQRKFKRRSARLGGQKIELTKGAKLIRYADDFVVLTDIDNLKQIKEAIGEWLAAIGLRFNERKTRLTHTLSPYDGNVGFDFLGFNIRQYKEKRRRQGYITLIKPSNKAVINHYQHLAKIVDGFRSGSQAMLIASLNRVIRGWCNYYRTVVSSRIFSKLDWLLQKKLYKWGLRRHSNKRIKWVINKIFRPEQGRWRFTATDGLMIAFHSDCKITRHIKVRGSCSPYDGNELYWIARLQNIQPQTLKGKVLKRQKSKCAFCRLRFSSEEIIELHHIDGNHENYKPVNLALLHGHCHDQIHGSTVPSDLSQRGKSGRSRMRGKLSSPVLKPSLKGDL